MEIKSVIHRITREKFILKRVSKEAVEQVLTRAEQELGALQVVARANEALGLIDYFEDDKDIYFVTRKPK